MALFGGSRDISLLRNVNRELMHDIISQQCVIYKYNLEESKVNIYGESSTSKIYQAPVLLYCLIDRSNQDFPIQELGPDLKWTPTFRFLVDDLTQANLVLEVGDIIMWQENYFHIDNTDMSQLFVGKDPDYPFNDDNGNNPLETDLGNFGWNRSLLCLTHYVPADKAGITKERM